MPLYLLLCAVAALWIDCSRIHLGQTSDSLIPILVSLQQWTPFYWEQSRFGMLVPLVALPFDNPLVNLLVQDGLMIFSGLAAIGLLTHFFVRSKAWFAAACGSCAGMILFLAEPLRCDYFLAQPYGVSFALGLGALLVLERRTTGPRWALALIMMLLASWVNLAVGPALILVIAARWAGQRLAWRRAPARLVALVLAGTAVGLILERSAPFRDPQVTRLAPAARWLDAGAALVSNTLHQSGPAYRSALLLLAIAAAAAFIVAAGRRRRIIAAVLVSTLAGAMALLALAAISRWTALNGFSPRYVYMALFTLQTGLIAAIVLAFRTRAASASTRRWGRLTASTAALSILAATGWTYGTPSLATVRASLTERCEAAADAILPAQCTHVAGDYWRVWPAVYHAIRTSHEQGTPRNVWGMTYRSLPTQWAWAADLSAARIAVLGHDQHSEFVEKWGLAPANPAKTLEILAPCRCLSPFFHKLSALADRR
ncbi:MAG: hypothetical protein L0Y71_10285 [Gemmataceae bacterium]|nr:hypothetical protein [Gemmataceae bacterium]